MSGNEKSDRFSFDASDRSADNITDTRANNGTFASAYYRTNSCTNSCAHQGADRHAEPGTDALTDRSRLR